MPSLGHTSRHRTITSLHPISACSRPHVLLPLALLLLHLALRSVCGLCTMPLLPSTVLPSILLHHNLLINRTIFWSQQGLQHHPTPEQLCARSLTLHMASLACISLSSCCISSSSSSNSCSRVSSR